MQCDEVAMALHDLDNVVIFFLVSLVDRIHRDFGQAKKLREFVLMIFAPVVR
jgi:hypothetical protein